MLTIKKNITALLLAAMPFFVFAQCPEGENIARAIQDREVTQLKNLVEKLQSCDAWQDSLGLVWHTLGVAAYIDDDLEEAVKATQKALEIRQRVLPDPHFETGRSRRNLGVFHKELGQWDQAAANFKAAAEIFDRLDSMDVADAYRELALVFYQKGDFDRAIQTLDLATIKAKSFSDDYTLMSCYLEYGNILPEKERYQSAVDSLLKAEKMLAVYDPWWEHAVCYTNLALNYSSLQQYEKSISYGQQAIDLWQEMEAPWELATTLNNQGVTLIHSKKYKAAEQMLLKGRQVASENDMPLIRSQSYDNLGELYFQQQQYEKALEYFHQAVLVHLRQPSNQQYLSSPQMETLDNVLVKKALLNDLSDKGKALLALFDQSEEKTFAEAALENYKRCDYLVDLLRREHTVQSSKIYWREKVVPIYEKAIEAAYLLEDYESAFFFFEKSRAVLLLDAMLNAQALNTLKDEGLKKEEARLRKALIEARQQLDRADDSERGEVLSQLVQLNDAFESLTNSLSEKFPNYHRVKFATEVIRLESFKKELEEQKGDVLIHYFMGRENTWMLAVYPDEKTVFRKLGNSGQTAELVEAYLAFFTRSYSIANDPSAFAKASNDLFKYLLGQLDLSDATEIVIVPDGMLGFVPFEALLTSPVEHSDLGGMPYLILDHTVRLSFSATVLEKQNNQIQSNGRILAMAPFSSESTYGDYPVLPFSADEVSKIQRSVDGKYLTGRKASKKQFRDYVKRYAVLHLSTHAEADQTDGQPVIAFADTVLTLSELYSMDIPAKMIVLSACETNIGEVKSGEGIFSLSRGFAYAGANSTIASLWNVNAASTGEIFPVFYENLKKGNSKSRALREAKLQFLNKTGEGPQVKTPYDWAGFSLMGNNEAIELNSPGTPWYYYLIPLVVFAWVFMVRKRQKANQEKK